MSSNQPKRLKILLGCYACDPNRGSEPGTGWNFAHIISKYHDVHAIVEQDEFEQSLSEFSKQNPDFVQNITFHFIKRKHHNILRKIWPPSYYWFYRSWQKKAYKLAKQLHKKEKFDIVHQVSLIGYREPGYLWKLGIPFVWGPIGGLNQTAWCLLKGMKFFVKFYFFMRNLLNYFQKRYSSRVLSAAKHASVIFVSDPQGIADVQKLWHKTPEIMREVGTSKQKYTTYLSNHLPHTPLKICWAGELIPLKALDILLDAISLCKHPMQVEVLGQGPELGNWKKKCKSLKLNNSVTFHGFVPHVQVTSIMQECHVLCVTSIKEGGTSTVVLEALQCGLPIIALNHCGHASVINDKCGYKIDIQSRSQITQEIATKLDILANNEELRRRLGVSALKHSSNYTWATTGKKLNDIYLSIVNS